MSRNGRTVTLPRPAGTDRDRLVEQYLPLVRYVLGRLAVALPRTLDREDLFSSGVFGLMHAAASFDPARGASFKTYAYTAIRGAMLDELRRHDPVPRNRRERIRRMDEAAAGLASELGRPPSLEELAQALGTTQAELDDDLLALRTANVISIDHPLGEDGEPATAEFLATHIDPADEAVQHEQKEMLAACIGELCETERRVVVLYYLEGLLLKEIGTLLGVTESRISQILTRAVVRLRLMMETRGSDRGKVVATGSRATGDEP